ncbi:MAG TPA: pectinesterase family protein [Longimicrobiaceae bacterium]|nr:pectinesterase family protein [Longimicrobiaceae bacterium]
MRLALRFLPFALLSLVLAAAGPGTPATHAATAQTPRYDALVDASYRGRAGTLVGGTPVFRTLGAALAAAPGDTTGYTVFLRDGRYHEKLTVRRAKVHLIGESRDGTVITYDAAAGMPSPAGGTYGTSGSFTLRVLAPDFTAEHLTVENAFDYAANAAKPDGDPTKLAGAQAVALMTDSASDRAVFRDVRISGNQDTLYPDAGRQYFEHCMVSGSVDFIFGAGRAVFDDCDIVSLDRGSATNNGYVTAPSTPRSQPYGFVFIRSRLRKASPAMAAGSVALGRPWHPSSHPGVLPSAVFIDCTMDDHIGARGWASMSGRDASGARRTYLPGDSRFFEHGSRGPGAVASPSRPVLPEDALPYYTIDRVLAGWDPAP